MPRALVWFRRDLRLADNPALRAALDAGHEPVPVYVHAPEEEGEWAPGAASNAWLAQSLAALDRRLRERGSRLLVRRGPSEAALRELAMETGAVAVHWNRRYEPAVIARDKAVKAALGEAGLEARSHKASLLFEPWEVETGQGEPYRVFTPFWRKASAALVPTKPEPEPRELPAVDAAPGPDVEALGLVPTPRWDRGFWDVHEPGEEGAWARLRDFLDDAVARYRDERDRPDREATSRLSPHLHFGELSPRQVLWEIDKRQFGAAAAKQADGFVRELGWREFSWHLLYHFPATATENLNPKFEDFDWADPDDAQLEAWRRGRTGVPLVDAGMRELWATGTMHNRVRMVVASYLTKNLRMHWLHGARWFWDTLVDADLANNTQGWQWTAGTGADAAPYFRIFNPVSQALKFDPQGAYIRRWVPELAGLEPPALFAPWEHPGGLQGIDYPRQPLVDPKASRERALEAYAALSR